MGFSLDGWASDHAGSVGARKPNTLLVAFTFDGPEAPMGLMVKEDLGGMGVFPGCDVTCLTPNSRPAFAIELTVLAESVMEIELAEMTTPEDKNPWANGVHLFSVWMSDQRYISSATFATAIIDDNLARWKPGVSEVFDFFKKSTFRMRSRQP